MSKCTGVDLPAHISCCRELLKATVVCKGCCAICPSKLMMGQSEGTLGPGDTRGLLHCHHYMDFIIE